MQCRQCMRCTQHNRIRMESDLDSESDSESDSDFDSDLYLDPMKQNWGERRIQDRIRIRMRMSSIKESEEVSI